MYFSYTAAGKVEGRALQKRHKYCWEKAEMLEGRGEGGEEKQQ